MRGAEISGEMTIFWMLFGFVISLILMSNNEVDSSKNVRSPREKELDEEIKNFHERANQWLAAINKDHEADTKQLKERIEFLHKENKALKHRIIQQSMKQQKPNKDKQLEEFAARCKKMSEKYDAELKQAAAEKESSYNVIRVHMRTNERLKEKLFDQLKALNYFRKKAGEWELSEEKLKQEVEGYYDEEFNKLWEQKAAEEEDEE